MLRSAAAFAAVASAAAFTAPAALPGRVSTRECLLLCRSTQRTAPAWPQISSFGNRLSIWSPVQATTGQSQRLHGSCFMTVSNFSTLPCSCQSRSVVCIMCCRHCTVYRSRLRNEDGDGIRNEEQLARPCSLYVAAPPSVETVVHSFAPALLGCQ